MPRPLVQPSSVCLKAEPGEVRIVHLTIAKVPASAQVTASVIRGAPYVKLKHFVALELVTRPMTAEEIAELPPFPPSIRQHAQVHGVSEFEEAGRSDDGGPLAVPAGAQVRFEIEFSAPQPPPPAVATATLSIEGSSWERVEVPMVFLTGTAVALPAVEPVQLRLALEPGETHTQDVVLAKAPQAATMVACIGTGDSIVRVKAVVAFRPVRKLFTAEELNELPPYPPNIREDAATDGYIEYQETGRADACKPLTVAAGALVKVYVEFTPPAQGAPDVVSTRLDLLGTTWHPVEVPIFLIIGKVETELGLSELFVRQGDSAELPLKVTSVAGPATVVHFELDQAGGTWQIAPPARHLPRAATLLETVKVAAAPETSLGVYGAVFRVWAFERLQLQERSLKLTVLPGRVSVQALQSSVSGVQGGTATCKVRVTSTGGYKRMTFLAGTLPEGVELYAPPREFGPGTVTLEFDLSFNIGLFARPVANAHVLIYWSVDDGVHAGFQDLPFTVLVTLQSRTFGQPVVTPAGTALGGYAELILTNNGNCRFRGHMRATGLPSYKFRVRAVLRSANGLLTVAAQKTGEVKGTLDPGARQFDWDEPVFSQLVADRWADVQSASMVASKSYGMSGVLGTLGDLLVDWWEYLAANIVIGPVAGVIFLGSELGVLTGWQWSGPGGLVGLGVAGGVAFLTGPTMIIPAMIGGTLVGSQLIKSRAMTTAEKDFAATVFGDTIPTDRIILTNLIGLGGVPFTVPAVDGSILLNLGDAGYDSPLTQPLYPANGYTVGGQVFIHELTHAWQIEHWPMTIGYFWEAALDHIDRQESARYGPAGPLWSSFGQEQQAKIVDHWFAGTTAYAKQPPPTRLPMDPNDPYFTYIANNIRMGQS